MRANGQHDTEPIHLIDHIPRSCWTCLYWDGGDVANHLCVQHPGESLTIEGPCDRYVLWDTWLYVEWFYPQKTRKTA